MAVAACGSSSNDGTVDAPVDVVAGDAMDDAAIDATPANIMPMIASGAFHNCALAATGAIRCWGMGGFGRLGYGNVDNIGDTEVPRVAGDVDVGGTVTQLALGGGHSCALLATGAVRCWGANGNGELGLGHQTFVGDTELPSSVGTLDLGGTVVEISAGIRHSCARLATGGVRCWGDGSYGMLGYAGDLTPLGDDEVAGARGDVDIGAAVLQLAVGGDHTCAVVTGGAVRCWGRSNNGRLGYANNNNIGDGETPASAGDVNVGGAVMQLAAGESHTCAVLTTGAVRCWGANDFGQLGYGNTSAIGDDEVPATAGDVNVGGTAVQVVTGALHTCALLSTGAVRCWGYGGHGQLGYGNTNLIGDNELPSTAGDVPVGGTVVQLAAFGLHTCAQLSTGAVQCWGQAMYGQLGYANVTNIGDTETPASAGNVDIW